MLPTRALFIAVPPVVAHEALFGGVGSEDLDWFWSDVVVIVFLR